MRRQALPYTGINAPELIGSLKPRCATISSAIEAGFTQEAWSALGMSLRFVGVSMVGGASAISEMFSPLSSSGRATVKAAAAAFRAVEAAIFSPHRALGPGLPE